jgi:RNA polymerase sigma-70 factor (ECF subfamily)
VTDQELIDARDFDALYHRYRDWVAALAMRFTRNHDDAMDVVQETFTYLFRKLPELKLRAQMKSFLYPAVKHVALRWPHWLNTSCNYLNIQLVK